MICYPNTTDMFLLYDVYLSNYYSQIFSYIEIFHSFPFPVFLYLFLFLPFQCSIVEHANVCVCSDIWGGAGSSRGGTHSLLLSVENIYHTLAGIL